MDHKTGFKMTLGQNEKFCWPFKDLLNKSNLRM